MAGFSDIHNHFIYGVDDGAKTREDMLRMLDAAAEQGITELAATPHVTPGVYSFDEAIFERHFEEAQAYCRTKAYPITLIRGAEILYTPTIEQDAIAHKLPTYEQTNVVLLEFANEIPYEAIERGVTLLDGCGYEVILAHVERYTALNGHCIYTLKKAFPKLRYQMNCNTVLHPGGWLRGSRIHRWLRQGLIDYVASDAHNAASRPFRMERAHEELCLLLGTNRAEELTGWQAD